MLAARAEKSAQATFRVGTTVAAKPIAFGAKFAASVPGDALYRGKIVRLEDEGETEEARVWVVRYDDDGSEYATSEKHLSAVAPAARRPTTTARPKAAAPKGKLHNPFVGNLDKFRIAKTKRPDAPARPSGPRRRRQGARAPAAPAAPRLADMPKLASARADMPKLAPARKPSNEEAKPPKRARARRLDPLSSPRAEPAKLFALLDLDGTLFHMMPEGELPGGLDVICEGVVPRIRPPSALILDDTPDGPRGRRRGARARNGSKCVILDDNPTAWEAYAAQLRLGRAPVRRPPAALVAQALEEEVTLLPRLSARCRDLFAKADRPRANSQNGPTPRGGPARAASTSPTTPQGARRARASSFDDEKRKPNVIRTFSESRPQLSRRAEPARNLQPIRSFDAKPRPRTSRATPRAPAGRPRGAAMEAPADSSSGEEEDMDEGAV
ncbi:hypothetical protein SO694_00002573 [Aureococcus anophagefferens]|uniref:Tudor domain-containing protein n=1 Tax=Aureococcus anophagefferens TaxID=44056 RepID=A0ABR1GD90_AURAN